MPIEVACPGCGKTYRLPETQVGKRARCKRCRSEFRIDLPSPAQVEKPAAKSPTPPPLPPPKPIPPAVPVARIEANCPACGYRYDLDPSLAGKRARCKGCGEVFRVAIPPPVSSSRPEPILDALIDDDLPVLEEYIEPVAKSTRENRPKRSQPAPRVVEKNVAVFDRLKTFGKDRRVTIALAICVAIPVFWLTSTLVRRALLGHEPTVEADAFDPFPDSPPGPEGLVRSRIVEMHRETSTGIAETSEQIVETLGTILDAPSSQRHLARLRELESRREDWKGRQAKLATLNLAEDRQLLNEYGMRFTSALEKERNELKRIHQFSGTLEAIRERIGRLNQAIAIIHLGIGHSSLPPCVDVLFPGLDTAGDEAIATRLRLLSDVQPPKVFEKKTQTKAGKAGVAYRIGPVADAASFARKINFGTVRTVGRRKIVVVDTHAP